MSKVQIDFNNIKYNLYEILNVKPDADPVKIKKNFLRIIKNFHPDKNSELEEEIYNHIILANQILLDKEYRTKYDEYINDTAETFQELKNVFNKKHGYNEDNTSESVLDKFNKIKEKRDSIETQVDKEDFKTVEEFNKKFTVNKLEGGKFYEQIVEYKGVPQELSTYIIGEQYTSLQDIDKLYIEDSIQSSKYSSLDRAFILQPNNINESVLDKFNKIKEYKDQTDYYKKRTPVDYSKKKFDEW
jgi:curved DNA-binding protein CbpA